ncbi:MAG TPA: bifunctional glutamate N-acetyltransferase/amino-acid acetyltransferase ArgJ [Roseiflexaceae bacterium]|nr:bifunctional glutamate N-acetyltransferase/amino-acid acetyltransferase ArgJ [Roseiflexaceae bacterium]
MSEPLETFSLAKGFRATATSCGLKTSGVMGASALDMALVAAEGPCSAAGVFTTNKVKAAPVRYDQEVLAANPGGIRAVVVNAGNANACTGPQGMVDCRRMAELVAYGLRCQPGEVLVLSTGVIGRPLPMEKVAQGIATLTSPAAGRGAALAARAIMTTDTRPKVASARIHAGGRAVTISGFCKGAGMIHPNMATMLAVITTDAQVAPEVLDRALRAAVNKSFNRISVDGDTSTNDTVLLLASGASGVTIVPEEEGRGEDSPSPQDTSRSLSLHTFISSLTDVCVSLAKQVARDGEGATRLVEILVTGARSEAEAHQVANSIARSPLVKTAVHGGDPNWGRVLCAAGYSGADIDPERLSLTFGPADRPGDSDTPAVQVVAGGLPTDADLRLASAALRADPAHIHLDLGLGQASATVWTCDLSAEYVTINAHYTT